MVMWEVAIASSIFGVLLTKYVLIPILDRKLGIDTDKKSQRRK